MQCNYTRNYDVSSIVELLQDKYPITTILNKLVELGIPSIDSFLSKTVNAAINGNNMQYYPYLEDIAYYTFGLIMSIDDNVLLGATQKVVGLFENVTLPEDNRFYESGKILGDKVFLAVFKISAGISTEDAIILANTAQSLWDSRLFAGTLSLEVKGAAVIDAVGAACTFVIAVVAGIGAEHSEDELNADTAKLEGTNYTSEYNQLAWNDQIMAYVKGTPMYNWFVTETQDGKLHTFFDLGGFDRDADGVYHAKQDALQKYGGYNDLYDEAFHLASSMGSLPFNFATKTGRIFRIWLWKGDYLNLGAGAEIGIYYDGGPQWLCGTQYKMPMTLNLINNKTGIPIFNYNPPENDWWCTGFNPAPEYQNVNASDLTASGRIDFTAYPDMWKAFTDTYDEECEDNPKWKIWSFDPKKPIAYFTWQGI